MKTTTLHALAEPNRLQIVELLKNGPLTVGEIADQLMLRQPQASKHLKKNSVTRGLSKSKRLRIEEFTSFVMNHFRKWRLGLRHSNKFGNNDLIAWMNT